MSLNKEYFTYYYRISVKEGFNTDLKTSELMLGKYERSLKKFREIYQKCKYCHQVIEIKKGFKEDASICNMCFKLLRNADKINPQTHVIWIENQKCRIFTDFHCSYVDRIFRYENIKDKSVEISQEVLDTHFNACLNACC